MDRFVITTDLTDAPKQAVLLSGTYSYWNRIPSLSKKEPMQYLSALDEKYSSTGKLLYKFLRDRYNKEKNEITNFTPKKAVDAYGDFRYLRLYNDGIIQDRFNTIELLCGMSYSKGLALFYTLYDKLDYAIAFLFDEDLELVRQRLMENCSKYNIDYLTLSYAFCTGDPAALELLNLGCLVGVAPKLDFKLLDILESRVTKFKIGTAVLDLAESVYSDEERITLYLCTKIGYLSHLVINLILKKYQNNIPPFISCVDTIPVSVGRCNLVIASTSMSLPVIEFHIKNNVMSLRPHTIMTIGEANEDCWYTN